MAYSRNILLGKIIKVNARNGTVTVGVTSSFVDNIPEMESVFVEIDNRPIPFFIDESETRGNDLLNLKLADYNTADKLKEFNGCRVFLTSGGVLNNENCYEDLTGFSVFDENGNKMGTVNSIIQNPGQWLLEILSPQKKEILLPFHKDLILETDSIKRIVVIKIPEGLLDIN
ncbi:MAG: ribosome maturation factor RimM [Bacteroidales bacterium]|jgi:16S rRNA processing protein RimM|nr:ribosome maturation factor RimM [Bacteroidales bacterium]